LQIHGTLRSYGIFKNPSCRFMALLDVMEYSKILPADSWHLTQYIPSEERDTPFFIPVILPHSLRNYVTYVTAHKRL
jgi:hypothetical protein